MLTLANPAGLWALLGIPAVLAIHFLQRQAVVLPISTLFLLEKTQRESASGRRFDRLMNSVPLWMQLLGVLLLAWLLAEPRYQKARSTQRVAVVLDSSASMSVFKETLKEQLLAGLPDLQGQATALELTLLESTTSRERLYHGNSVEECITAVDSWEPRDGLSDPSSALRLARSLVAREGIVVYATDTPFPDPPFETRVLAVGEAIDNVGITGINFERKEGTWVWTALIKNYSSNSATRSWQLQFPDGTSTQPRSFDLEPGALVSLQGAFPDDQDRGKLSLSPDRFTIDDSCPMVRPAPKSLSLSSSTSPAFSKLAARMTQSLEAIEPVDEQTPADISLVSYDPLDPALPDGNAIVFVDDGTSAGAYLKGGIVAEKHPLVDGLNWQALLIRETIQLERLPTDDVLLWQATRPLIFLRELAATPTTPAHRQLYFNFDLRRSNAATQPAFIVCLHRFTESVRDAKVSGFRDNLETGQPIQLATHANNGSAQVITIEQFDENSNPLSNRELAPSARILLSAPLNPGFLRIRQGEIELLDAALYFADTREADFSACASSSSLDTGSLEAIQRHTVEDHWWRAWILVLIAALLISWHFTKERSLSQNAAAELTAES